RRSSLAKGIWGLCAMGCWKGPYYHATGGRYIGLGPFAEEIAALDEEIKELDRKARAVEEAKRQTFTEARQRARRVDGLLRQGLEALGYHRAFRGQWRKRRFMSSETLPHVARKAAINLQSLAESEHLHKHFGSNPEVRNRVAARFAELRADL